jgi:hypothetical protein
LGYIAIGNRIFPAYFRPIRTELSDSFVADRIDAFATRPVCGQAGAYGARRSRLVLQRWGYFHVRWRRAAISSRGPINTVKSCVDQPFRGGGVRTVSCHHEQ